MLRDLGAHLDLEGYFRSSDPARFAQAEGGKVCLVTAALSDQRLETSGRVGRG
jgi:hypothetical protein